MTIKAAGAVRAPAAWLAHAVAHLFKELTVFAAVPESVRAQYAPPLPEILAACVARA